MAQEITKDEYRELRRHGYAGSDVDWVTPEAAARWRERGWKGKHWRMVPGPALTAVNVEGDG